MAGIGGYHWGASELIAVPLFRMAAQSSRMWLWSCGNTPHDGGGSLGDFFITAVESTTPVAQGGWDHAPVPRSRTSFVRRAVIIGDS